MYDIEIPVPGTGTLVPWYQVQGSNELVVPGSTGDEQQKTPFHPAIQHERT